MFYRTKVLYCVNMDFLPFLPVTLTFTRWPSYMKLTHILWIYTGIPDLQIWTYYVKAFERCRLTDRQTDRQTDVDRNCIPRRLAGNRKFGAKKWETSLYRTIQKYFDTLNVQAWLTCVTLINFYRAACNADAVLWWEFCPSVCLSVCLSHAWIVTKRKKDLSRFLCPTKDHLA